MGMRNKNDDVKIGKFLSLVLRHQPQAAGITLDANGWASVDELIAGVNRSGRRLDRAALERIVAENNKKRYSFNEDRTKIRANQGHSLSVDVELKEQKPPARLYHGTARHLVPSIKLLGIKKGTRQHVHLSDDPALAMKVGSRHGEPALLEIEAAAMHELGHIFYKSENDVWLVEFVPSVFVKERESQS